MNVQLCYPWEEVSRIPLPCLVSPKLDGVRAYTVGGVFFSRQGKVLRNMESMQEDIAKLGPYVFDGELVDVDWNKTVSTVHTQFGGDGSKIIYNVFDILTIDEWTKQLCDHTQIVRTAILKRMSKDFPERMQMVPVVTAGTVEKIVAYMTAYVNRGYEGVIVKDPHAPYMFKRHRSWIKLKPYREETFKVIDALEGTGKYVGMLGALVIEVGATTCRLGTGFDDQQRTEMWKSPPLGHMVEVRFQEKTNDGSLRFPSFLRLRTDLAGSATNKTS